MANRFARIILFLSSYIPLWVIFGVVTVREQIWLGLSFFALATLSFLGTLFFLGRVQRMAAILLPIGIIRRKDSDTMSYIASYVIPFASTALDKPEQVTAIIIFLVVLCIVYVNSGMIHINPVLSMLGYSPFEVEDERGNSIFVLSRRSLRRGNEVCGIEVADGIFVEKQGDDRKA